jgi:hypothetical protein
MSLLIVGVDASREFTGSPSRGVVPMKFLGCRYDRLDNNLLTVKHNKDPELQYSLYAGARVMQPKRLFVTKHGLAIGTRQLARSSQHQQEIHGKDSHQS